MQKNQNQVATNVKRLLDDARTLADNGRLRTATALAVLAFEECGKVCAAYWFHNRYITQFDDKVRTGHIHRQTLFLAYRSVKALRRDFKIIRKDDINENDYKILQNINRDALLNDMAKSMHSNVWALEILIESNMLNHIKQAGLYTDLDENMEYMDNGVVFSKNLFAAVEYIVEEAIEMTNADDFTHQIAAAIYSATRRKSDAQHRFTDKSQLIEAIRRATKLTEGVELQDDRDMR